MRFSYEFSNLCGTVYKTGNVVFTPDGNSVLSPVGNRITVFDLKNNKSRTLPFENRKDILRVALSPDGNTLVSIDRDGRALLCNLPKRVVLARHNFKKRVWAAEFSPDGRFLAVSHGTKVQLWAAPQLVSAGSVQFAPFTLLRTYIGHSGDVISIQWSSDSKFFITGAKDNTAKIFSSEHISGYIPLTLTGHRNYVVGAWFSKDGSQVYTVGKDAALFCWTTKLKAQSDQKAQVANDDSSASDSDEDLDNGTGFSASLEAKHYFNQNHALVTSVALHHMAQAGSCLLVVGFASGIFGLYELPDFNNIHTLSISSQKIGTVAINPSGEWLAFGSSKLGQLLVWEWQSETYVLKQQGHFHDVNCLDYSPDGQLVATGGDDGKVKLWNADSGFCFVTFSDHQAPVTGIVFSQSGTVVLSSSLDGTVRAYDLVRYKNFRTMASPAKAQFLTCAIDAAGEIVAAGSQDPFEIYIWSLQTGRLLDVLSGHEGPVSGLAFSPKEHVLASSSWDKTVRLWEFTRSSAAAETLRQQSDVLAVAFRPDGDEICTATLDGQLTFWDVKEGQVSGALSGTMDIRSGRRKDDPRSAKNSTKGTCFTSVCYSADGSCVLAGGNSKFVCIYAAQQRLLLRKFQISHNRSLDGVLDFLNSKHVQAHGVVDSDDEDIFSSDDDLRDEDKDQDLPGVRQGEFQHRSTKQAARTKCVRFAPTGRSWACASTEGLLMYSLDTELTFDPTDLDLDVTPKAVKLAQSQGSHARALALAVRLNQHDLISDVIEHTPADDIALVVRSVPTHYLHTVLSSIVRLAGSSRHIDFYLRWVGALLSTHGQFLHKQSARFLSVFRDLHKTLSAHFDDMAKLCHDTQFRLQFLSSFQNDDKIDLLADGEEAQDGDSASVDFDAIAPQIATDTSDEEAPLSDLSDADGFENVGDFDQAPPKKKAKKASSLSKTKKSSKKKSKTSQKSKAVQS